MSLDDVAEKARRNLMILTTGILTVVALGIPLDGKLVGAVNLSEVEPTRAWICAIVALGYFYLRFRLSPSMQKVRAGYHQDKLTSRKTRDERYVTEQYGKVKRGEKAKLHFELPPLPKSNYQPGNELVQGIALEAETLRGRSGSIRFLWRLVEGVGISNLPAGEAKFHIPWHWTLRQNIAGHFGRVLRVRWGGLEVTLPSAMTLAALAVCVWKIGISREYWAPFTWY